MSGSPILNFAGNAQTHTLVLTNPSIGISSLVYNQIAYKKNVVRLLEEYRFTVRCGKSH